MPSFQDDSTRHEKTRRRQSPEFAPSSRAAVSDSPSPPGGRVLELEPATESGRLLRLASRYKRIVVLAHDNPDPDSISTGWAICHMVKERLPLPCRLVAGGQILRAENRHMMHLLDPPLQLNAPLGLDLDTLVILVDCGLTTRNHPPIDAHVYPVAVIDHHVRQDVLNGPVVFKDIRPDVAATASIATSYLIEQKLEPSASLATALLYALRTETKAGEFHHSDVDKAALNWLTARANPEQMARIQDAPLERVYLRDLSTALNQTAVYDGMAMCLLSDCHGPEVVGEVADLLVRCRGIRAVLCAARYRHNILLSVRTTPESGKNAAHMTTKLLDGIGHGGGHRRRAGGMVPNVSRKDFPRDSRELKRRWLELWNLTGSSPTRLVSAL